MAMTVGEQAFVQAIIQQRDSALQAAAAAQGRIAEMRAQHAEEIEKLKKAPAPAKAKAAK